MSEDPVDLSEAFLLAVRREEPTDEYERRLAAADSDELAAGLETDGARIAFWSNLYNAATQRLLDRRPALYETRRRFFAADVLTVAGETLTLDQVEHGVLRCSYSKLTLGYLRRPFRDAFLERHELDERDPRIHFVLNCGAASCPPIAAYSREAVDDQLDLATRGYLDETVAYDPDRNEVRAPRVMRWFRGDFRVAGGRLAFLRRYDQVPADAEPTVRYRDWDWSRRPRQFADDLREAVSSRED